MDLEQPEHSDGRLQWSLLCGSTENELRLARTLADRVSVADESREALRVVIGELASNAVRHALTPYTVTLTANLEAVTIEVQDQSLLLPQLRKLMPSQPGGRGLHIVNGLSDAWGTTTHGDAGKTVWARIDHSLPTLRQGL